MLEMLLINMIINYCTEGSCVSIAVRLDLVFHTFRFELLT